jgi:hypothetical protein
MTVSLTPGAERAGIRISPSRTRKGGAVLIEDVENPRAQLFLSPGSRASTSAIASPTIAPTREAAGSRTGS